MFYERNRGMLLRQLIRASAAAPSYFAPQKVDVGSGEIGTFIDGGVSLANNPALQLFLLTTLKGFPFHWKTGEKNLYLLSVGTGTFNKKYNPDIVAKKGLLGWAKMIPELFMEDANYMNQTILQYLSESNTAQEIDIEVNNLSGDLIHEKKALSYTRYNVLLETNPLQHYGFRFTERELESLREMSDAHNKDVLYEIGARASEKMVMPEHIH